MMQMMRPQSVFAFLKKRELQAKQLIKILQKRDERERERQDIWMLSGLKCVNAQLEKLLILNHSQSQSFY